MVWGCQRYLLACPGGIRDTSHTHSEPGPRHVEAVKPTSSPVLSCHGRQVKSEMLHRRSTTATWPAGSTVTPRFNYPTSQALTGLTGLPGEQLTAAVRVEHRA